MSSERWGSRDVSTLLRAKPHRRPLQSHWEGEPLSTASADQRVSRKISEKSSICRRDTSSHEKRSA
jgi:hypothetical protein